MRVKREGNRIYTIYRLFPELNKKIKVVARDNAHARKIVATKFKQQLAETDSIAVTWDIYDANRGITTLPLGTVIHCK